MANTDRVIIRRYAKNGIDELVAFLPDAPATYGFIMSYVHVGQHGEASLDFYHETIRVNDKAPDAQELIAELKSIGYNVKLTHRLTRPFGGWAK